jgi:hypothetical protein
MKVRRKRRWRGRKTFKGCEQNDMAMEVGDGDGRGTGSCILQELALRGRLFVAA